MIYVRVYEQRMDLLRAVIVGPSGTPYHDGLFFFDFRFPTDYPNSPPVRICFLQWVSFLSSLLWDFAIVISSLFALQFCAETSFYGQAAKRPNISCEIYYKGTEDVLVHEKIFRSEVGKKKVELNCNFSCIYIPRKEVR